MNDWFDVKDKVVLVTGGATGVGLMMAEGLVAAGCRVYIASRRLDLCEAEAERLGGNCHPLQVDLANHDSLRAMVDEIGQRETVVHGLVNNAGATWGAPFETYPDRGWQAIHDVNVKAPFVLTQALLPKLAAAAAPGDPARVINVGSIFAVRTEVLNAYAYGASKAAIHHLTRVMAKELAPKSITVNAIAPGFFPSEMTEFLVEDEERKAGLLSQIPLGRLGEAADIGALLQFLLSKGASFMTGAIVPLDGGALIAS